MAHEVNHTVGVAPLVVVPGHELDELGVEHDASLGVKHRTNRASHEVLRHEGLVGVSEEALHVSVGATLDLLADVLVGSLLLQVGSQVDHRHIRSGHTEGHAGQLALKLGDHLGHSLGSSGGGGDDVGGSATASTPVLLGRTVHDHLGGGHGVHSGHQSRINTISVVDSLHHRGKAVGGARGARHVGHIGGVVILVDAHDDGGGVILGGGREDDLLHAGVDVGLGGICGKEDAGGLAQVVDAEIAPSDLLRLAGVGGLDSLSVDDHVITVNLKRSAPTAVDGVVLELVSHVLSSGTGVDSLKVGAIVLDHNTGYETTDTAETIDTHVISHGGLAGGGAASRSEGGSHSGNRDDKEDDLHSAHFNFLFQSYRVRVHKVENIERKKIPRGLAHSHFQNMEA